MPAILNGGCHITRSKRPWSYVDPASTQMPGQPD